MDLGTDILSAIEAHLPYDNLSASLRQRHTHAAYKQLFIKYGVAHSRGYHRLPEFIRDETSESAYYAEMVDYGGEHLQVYPHPHIQQVVQYTSVTPLAYYVGMLATLLKEERSYDTIPNFTAVDILNMLGVGRNQYLDLTKAVRGKVRRHANRSHIVEHLPSEMQSSVIMDPFATVSVVEQPLDVVRRRCGNNAVDISLYRLIQSQGDAVVTQDILRELNITSELIQRTNCVVCMLPFEPLHRLYRRALVYTTFTVTSEDHIMVPPLEQFVMNRTSSDSREVLLYRVLSTLDDRTPLSLLAQLLMMEEEDICDTVYLFICLGLARLRSPHIPNRFFETVEDVHPSWRQTVGNALVRIHQQRTTAFTEANTINLFGSPTSSTNHPFKRIALLYDASLTGFLMMTNLSKDPIFKQHAVTLFEVGKLQDENLESFVNLLQSIDSAEVGAFGGEAQVYIHSVLSLRSVITALRKIVGPAKAMGVDMLKTESLNELEATTRYSVLGRNYWAYVAISPLACSPLIDIELGGIYGSSVNLMPSPWMVLFLYHKMQMGPLSVLLPFGNQCSSLPNAFFDASQPDAQEGKGGSTAAGYAVKLRLQAMTLGAEVVYADLDTALLLISEMTSAAPVFVQCAASMPLIEKPDGIVVECPFCQHVEITAPFNATKRELHWLLMRKLNPLYRENGLEELPLVGGLCKIWALLQGGVLQFSLKDSLGYFVLSVTIQRRYDHMVFHPSAHMAALSTKTATTTLGSDTRLKENIPDCFLSMSDSADDLPASASVDVISVNIVSIGLGLPLAHVDCCALMLNSLPAILTDTCIEEHNKSVHALSESFGVFLEEHSSLNRAARQRAALRSTTTGGPMTQQHLRQVGGDGDSGMCYPTATLWFDGEKVCVIDELDPLSAPL